MSAASSVKQLNSWKVVGGYVKKYLHQSSSTKTEMKFNIFFPPSLSNNASGAPPAAKVPAVYWLSGLTCTEDNFMQKAGAFQAAAAANVAIICPDTSPRGANIGPEEKASWCVHRPNRSARLVPQGNSAVLRVIVVLRVMMHLALTFEPCCSWPLFLLVQGLR